MVTVSAITGNGGGTRLAQVSADAVKALRERSGAGMMDCKRALMATDNDIEKAVDWLRTHGLAAAAKKAGRAAREGIVSAYVHPGGRIGVLLELNCETDFVARTEQFQQLARDLAMQVAASAPAWVRREDVPPGEVERERLVLEQQAATEGKPAAIIERMVAGRMKKFYEEHCLMEQPFVKDDSKTVEELIQGVIARLGENIVARRFARFQLGESGQVDGAATLD